MARFESTLPVLRLCRTNAAAVYGDGGATGPKYTYPTKHPAGDEGRLRFAVEAAWLYHGNRCYHGGEGEWVEEWVRRYSRADPGCLVNATKQAVAACVEPRDRARRVAVAPGSKYTGEEPAKYHPGYRTGNLHDEQKHAEMVERKRAAQAKHQAAREAQWQVENERRVRDGISGMVGRVLANAAVEVSRASREAEAAKLAPTIALNKRLVRDKMVRVDRERRQRARVV